MHVLVATVRFILLVDLSSGSVEIIESHRPEYYGISWFPGSSDLVLSHSAVNNADLKDIATYATSEVGYLSEGARRSPPFLSQPHQIFCASDGRVVTTNTGRNRVQAVDLGKPGHLQEAGVSEARWDRLAVSGPFGDHLNSVFERDGHLYVIAHGHHNGSRLAVFTYPGMDLVRLHQVPNVTGIHNVFVENEDRIIGCHSDMGALIDLRRSGLLWQAGSAVYTRGLAASADCFFVGESEITSRDNRASCHAGIWIVDRHSFKTRDYLPLGCFGAVQEVRLLDVPDDAHHGVPLDGGRASLPVGLPAEGRELRVSDVSRAERLQASRAAEKNARYWGRFIPILGPAESNGEEGWMFTESKLLLATLREQAPALGTSYRLNTNRPSHVALVAGYQGNGADRCMDAFLLQSDSKKTRLQLWRHDGADWSVDTSVSPALDLPMEGNMEIKLAGSRASLFLNGKAVLADAPLQHHQDNSGRLGIRSLGASVRPAA